jgi:branched-chain amino acid transport system ATP-binding protein
MHVRFISNMVDLENRTFFTANNVSINFGALKALKNISFEVKKGSIFGIAGPNGAGKTTLLNIVSGALKPSGGEIYLHGEKISGLKPMHVCHKGVARTFQIPKVFSTLTVLENIKVGSIFGDGSRKGRSGNISEVIDFVGLRGKENLLAENIDLYSRKLLMLGAALATKPKLLLLDEPLAGFNYREVDDYLKLVRSMNEKMGVTFLVVEHIFDKLVEISDEIMILNFGEQIYLGSADKVAQDPKVVEVYLGIQHA